MSCSTPPLVLEYLRGDYTELVLGIFKSAQMTSVIAFALALAAFIYCACREKQQGKKTHKTT